MKRSNKLLAVSLAAATGFSSIGAVNTQSVQATEVITINPSIEYQTMEGFGTTVAWFGNTVGGWDTKNESGVELREEIAELLFSDDNGIGLNIIRYNIGGGENPSHDHMGRIEAIMPGYAMTVVAEANLVDGKDYLYDSYADVYYEYDWDADANQVWMMEQAIALRDEATGTGTNDIITEFFSNSPPYWMTNSLCATGNYSSSQNNLNDNYYGIFAQYLADVTAHFAEEEGITVDYLVPLNEPASSYWGEGSSKQEGSHFDAGASQSALYLALAEAMNDAGILDTIGISGLDETSVSVSLSSYNALSDEAKAVFDKFSTHVYGADEQNRIRLRDLMASNETTLWMSEVCFGGGANNHVSPSMSGALSLSGTILADLKDMQASAWIYWQAVESELEMIKWDCDYGFIHAVFEDASEPLSAYYANTTTYGGSAIDMDALGIDRGDYSITKQYYAMGQYSKFIKQGYTIIDSGDSDVLAALSPDKQTMVIVATNQNNTSEDKTFYLAGVNNVIGVDVYRTSDSENLAALDDITVSGQTFNAELAAGSITTFVINASGSMYNKGTSRIINDGVTGTGLNQFSYTGSWSADESRSGTAYSNDLHSSGTAGDTVSFKFNGTRAELYGSNEEWGGTVEVFVDGISIGTKDAYKSGDRAEKQLLADTGTLTEGNHTLTITILSEKNASSQGTWIALDYAKVTVGDVSGLFTTPVLSSARAWDSSVMVSFQAFEGASSYTLQYGTAPGVYSNSITGITALSQLVTGLNNSQIYYFVITAIVDGVETSKSNELEATPQLVNTTGTLYALNVGDPTTSTLDSAEYYFGAYNSATDQAYGVDAITGKTWGYHSTTATWARTDNADRYDSQRHGQGTDSFTYSFELADGAYDVTLGFREIWSGRTFGVAIEDTLVETIALTRSDQGVDIIKTYEVTVSDGQMDIEFQRVSDNPMVSWIEIDPVISVVEPGVIGESISGMTIENYCSASSSDLASYVLDRNTSTKWHTSWTTGVDAGLPHHIALDLEDVYNVTRVGIVPRQDSSASGGTNGNIYSFEIYTAGADITDTTDLSLYTKVAEGTWTYPNATEKMATFNTVEDVRYVWIQVLSGQGNYASAAEIYVYEGSGGNVDTSGLVSLIKDIKGMIVDMPALATPLQVLVDSGEAILANAYTIQETIDTFVTEAGTTIAAYGDLGEAVTKAAAYGETSGLNHNYLRRLAEKGQSIINDGVVYTDIWVGETTGEARVEITAAEIVAEVNACLEVLDELDDVVERAYAKIGFDTGNEDYRYMLELIEKAEDNSGYGLPASILKYVILDLETCLVNLENPVTYDSVQPGEFWYDNNGSIISAQGGTTIYVDGTYYWYGEDNRLSYALRTGVSCYSSTDLYNWTYEGIAFSVFELPDHFYTDPLMGTQGRIERPKVIYNETTEQYVLWMHLELYGGYGLSTAGVAVSDSPTGPFTYLHQGRPVIDTTLTVGGTNYSVSNQSFRDMNLFVDTGNDVNNDGAYDAYTIYSSEENNTLYIVRLNEDYTWVDLSTLTEAEIAALPVYSADYKGMTIENSDEAEYVSMPGLTDAQLYAYVEYSTVETIVNTNGIWTRHHRDNQREAPAPFKYNDNYYIITSAATGWNSNQAGYYMSTNILGPYTSMGDPAEPDSSTTFTSQPTSVIVIDEEKGYYVYMGDRWKNGDYDNGDVKNSPYVWLPIEFNEDGTLSIRWYDEWTFDMLGQTVTTFDRLEFMLGTDDIFLPETVTLTSNYDNTATDFAVEWAVNYNMYVRPGIYMLTGYVPALKMDVSLEVWVLSEDLEYFVNAGYTLSGADTPYENALIKLQDMLRNSAADQALGADSVTGNPWGYYVASETATSGSSNIDPFTSLRHRSSTYTAEANATDNGIGYQFNLPEGNYDIIAGFRLPSGWGGRTLYINAQGEQLAELSLETAIEKTAVVQNVTVGEDGVLDLYFSKTVGAQTRYNDPVVNWIMVVPHRAYESGDIVYNAELIGGATYNSAANSLSLSVQVTPKDGYALPDTTSVVFQVMQVGELAAPVANMLVDGLDPETIGNETIEAALTLPSGISGSVYVEVYVVNAMTYGDEGFDVLAPVLTSGVITID